MKLIVAVTKNVEEEQGLIDVSSYNFDIIYLPVLQIIKFDNTIVYNELNSVEADFLILTSKNTVRLISDFIREFKGKIIAVGSATAKECLSHGFNVDFLPEEFSIEGVITLLKSLEVEGKTILYPRSALAKNNFKEELNKINADVHEVNVYTVGLPGDECKNDIINKLNKYDPQIFVFTSPSAFNNLIKIVNINDVKKYFTDKKVAVIGPSTKRAVEEAGLNIDIFPDSYTLKSVLDKIKLEII